MQIVHDSWTEKLLDYCVERVNECIARHKLRKEDILKFDYEKVANGWKVDLFYCED